MIECPNCNRDISELDEICPKCGYIFEDEEIEEIKRDTEKHTYEEYEEIDNLKKDNIISLLIKGIAIISLSSGIVCFFSMNYISIYLVFGIISFAVLYGFGEIIQKLQNIENKL